MDLIKKVEKESKQFEKIKKLELLSKKIRNNYTKRNGSKVSATSLANHFGFKTYFVEFNGIYEKENIEAILGYYYPEFIDKDDTKVIYINHDKTSTSKRRYAITYEMVNIIMNNVMKNKKPFLHKFHLIDYDLRSEDNISYITRAILLPLDECYKLYNELLFKYLNENKSKEKIKEYIIIDISKIYNVPIDAVKKRIRDIKVCKELYRKNENLYNAKSLIEEIEKEAGCDYKKERKITSKRRSLIRKLGLNGYHGKYLENNK